MQFSCKYGGEGVSTWAKFDGRIYPVIMQKYLPFFMYCEVCCCLHIVYKHVNTIVYIGPSKSMCL